MITQKFKGDDFELQMEAAAKPAFDSCSLALDAFFEGGYSAADFLLMLYDAGRMPFSSRVPRDSFVTFIRQAIEKFPVTGTFEAYLFILEAIFGDGSEVEFTVSTAGKLDILVFATSAINFDAIAREFADGGYTIYDLVTDSGDQFSFTGITGIDSEAKLTALLSEIIPAGIVPTITLHFFSRYNWVAEEPGSVFYEMVDNHGNQIIFFETEDA